MLSPLLVYVVSAAVLVLGLIVLLIRQKGTSALIRFVLFELAVTVAAALLFFPLIYNPNILTQLSSFQRIQSLLPFQEVFAIPTGLAAQLPMDYTIHLYKSYIGRSVLPVFVSGCALGLCIRLSATKWKSFFAASAITCVGVELLKLLVCALLGSWYLTITPEDALYLFLGCLFGAFVVFLLRKLLFSVSYNSKLGQGFSELLYQKASTRPPEEGVE